MDTTETLIKRFERRGIDTDKIVYSICVGDIAECIAEVFEEKALSFSDEEIDTLIEKGIKALEWILWSEPVEGALLP